MTDNDALRRELDNFSDEKLEDILLERDEGAWRPEVFDIVTSILESRGISTRELTAPSQEDSERGAQGPLEGWIPGLVTVAEYIDPLEAHADRLALEQAGLDAWVEGDECAEGSTKVRVRAGDLAAAMGILEAPPVSASDLPPELAAPQCPSCGSHDVTEEEEEIEVVDPASSSRSAARGQIWLCRCSACKHTWSG